MSARLPDRLDARRRRRASLIPQRLVGRAEAPPRCRLDESSRRTTRRELGSGAPYRARRASAPRERRPLTRPLAPRACRRRRDGRAAPPATAEEGRRARGALGAARAPPQPHPASSRRNGAGIRRARPRSGRRRSGDRASLGGCPHRRRTRRGSPVAVLQAGPDSSPAADRGTSGRAGVRSRRSHRPRRAAPGRTRARSRAGRSARRRVPSAGSDRGPRRAGRGLLP